MMDGLAALKMPPLMIMSGRRGLRRIARELGISFGTVQCMREEWFWIVDG